jgi:hypothetical protein
MIFWHESSANEPSGASRAGRTWEPNAAGAATAVSTTRAARGSLTRRERFQDGERSGGCGATPGDQAGGTKDERAGADRGDTKRIEAGQEGEHNGIPDLRSPAGAAHR